MKKNIALIAGGYSGESIISLKTAKTIQNNLSAQLFNVYKIIITRDSWYYEDESNQKVEVDKNDFSITLNKDKIKFDAVFNAIHGTPGEDGRIQGYLDMLSIPYTNCNAIVSALTFHKSFCNKVVKDSNIVNISNSILLVQKDNVNIDVVLKTLKLPLFVKPNESGSSLGASKVNKADELLPAILKAFKEDNHVLVEEFIEGRELTIGVYKINNKVNALPPTEIVLNKTEIFDFEAKYTMGAAREITPAPISQEIDTLLAEIAKDIYQYLNCEGVVRMDFILQKDTQKLYFLEVNTMPGQSENSIVPQQLKAANILLEEFYNQLLLDILK